MTPELTVEEYHHYKKCPFYQTRNHDHIGKLWLLAATVAKYKGILPEEIIDAYLRLMQQVDDYKQEDLGNKPFPYPNDK